MKFIRQPSIVDLNTALESTTWVSKSFDASKKIFSLKLNTDKRSYKFASRFCKICKLSIGLLDKFL